MPFQNGRAGVQGLLGTEAVGNKQWCFRVSETGKPTEEKEVQGLCWLVLVTQRGWVLWVKRAP